MNEEKVDKAIDLLKKVQTEKSELEEVYREIKAQFEKDIKEYSTIHKITLKEDELGTFYGRPFTILPKSANEMWVVAPKFTNFSIGWLDHSEGAFNWFVVNRYTQWFGGIPDALRQDFNLPESEKIQLSDGFIVFDKGKEDKIKRQFGDYLSGFSDGRAKIKRGSEFTLISEIIRSGSLPFSPMSINMADMRPAQTSFDFIGEWAFQKQYYDDWLKWGSIGLFLPTGFGKSMVAIKALDSLIYDSQTANKLVITYTVNLVQQWQEYFKKFAPRLLNEVEVLTYAGAVRRFKDIKSGYRQKRYILTIFDECNFLPATTFSSLSTINTKYRMGLSATPYREDLNENLIIALTGKPCAADWATIMGKLGREYHEVNVTILPTDKAKLDKVEELFDSTKVTWIFCDSIALGEQVAKKYDIPHAHGGDKDALEIMMTSKQCVVSRVGDYGISRKDLQRVIEIDFLGKSRGQEVQRSGRILHSLASSKRHDILMTEEEFEKFGMRLDGLVEKGYKVNLITSGARLTSISRDFIMSHTRHVPHGRSYAPKQIKEKAERKPRMSEEDKEISKGFIKRKVESIRKEINDLSPQQRRILKYLIISRGAYSGKMSEAVGFEVNDHLKKLIDNRFVVKYESTIIRYNIKNKVRDDLKQYKATSTDIGEAVKEIEGIIRDWRDT